MLNYLTKEELSGFDLKASEYLFEQARASRYAASSSRVTVFLSHSHKDAEYVKRAAAFLKSLGVEVYVDWLDDGMPETTSPQTAKKLKEKISEHQKFILLATENSKDSKWVPWELGFADTKKGMGNIAILPIAESSTSYKGTEFIGIYPIIRRSFSTDDWIVRCEDPNIFMELSKWLTT